MSALSDITNAGIASVIPDYILSKPRLIEIGRSEVEFARKYMAMLAEGCVGFPLSIQKDVANKAADDIKVGDFTYGAPIWKLWAMSKSSVPYLTWLSLQVKHGDKVRMEDVANFYERGDGDAIAAATWQLWGLATSKKNDDSATDVGGAASTGQPSTADASPPPPKDSESPPISSST